MTEAAVFPVTVVDTAIEEFDGLEQMRAGSGSEDENNALEREMMILHSTVKG